MLTALEREGMYLRPRLWDLRPENGAPCPAWRGALGGARVLLVQSGMGAEATERALGWALSLRPARVLAAGFCGALGDLAVGDVVVPDEVGDGGEWHALTSSPLPRFGGEGRRGQLLGAGEPPHPHPLSPASGEGGGRRLTRLLTVPRPVLTAAQRRLLHERTRAVAVDMESAVAARLCRRYGVPFGCVRVVSDAGDLPPELGHVVEGERVRIGAMLRALARRPGLAANLWRLARQSQLAARCLADQVVAMAHSSDG